MRTVVVFVVIIVVSVIVSSQPPPPLPCCMARKFTATLTDTKTINTRAIVAHQMTVDFDQDKQALISTVFDPVTKERKDTGKIVYEYHKGLRFYVSSDNPDVCLRTNISWPMPPNCVPEDAEYIGTTYLGPLALLQYNGWRFPYRGAQANLTMGFSTEGCVPIVEGIVGDMNGLVDFVFLFGSYNTLGVDISVFNLPPSCNTTTSSDVGDTEPRK